MAKTMITSAQIQKKLEEKSRPKRRGRPRKEPELDQKEKIAAVCELFCKGKTASEIRTILNAQYPGIWKLTREEPYRLLSIAARAGWLKYHPPFHLDYRQKILTSYPFLKHVEVVRTSTASQVATAAADELLEIAREVEKQKPDKPEIHIGFSGGMSMQSLAAAFADLVAEPVEGLTKPLVIHALVSGFDPNHPHSDPNTYFTYFSKHKLCGGVEVRFVGLRSMAIVENRSFQELTKHHEIKQAFDEAKNLDIVVTSGADWSDGDSQLRRELEKSGKFDKTLKTLAREKVRGDIMWRPLGEDGPIETATEIRAMSVLNLSALPGFIAKGGRVLLMLGPCGKCHTPKGKLAKLTLDLAETLISDLVIDSRTGAQIVASLSPGANGTNGVNGKSHAAPADKR